MENLEKIIENIIDSLLKCVLDFSYQKKRIGLIDRGRGGIYISVSSDLEIVFIKRGEYWESRVEDGGGRVRGTTEIINLENGIKLDRILSALQSYTHPLEKTLEYLKE